MKYQIDFDRWNERKKEIEFTQSHKQPFFHEREVWWCAIGLNIGIETDGKNTFFERPILIIRKFNNYMFWGVPLTSKIKTGPFFYKVTHSRGNSYVILSQLKTFSSKRLLRKLGMITVTDFSVIQCKLQGLITIEPLQ